MTPATPSPAPAPSSQSPEAQPQRLVLLQGVNLLEGPDLPHRRADVLIRGGVLEWISPGSPGSSPGPFSPGEAGRTADSDQAAGANQILDAELIPGADLWLAPPLVDPHSSLEDPLLGQAETLQSLAAAAAAGGYGTVALLPWGPEWRD